MSGNLSRASVRALSALALGAVALVVPASAATMLTVGKAAATADNTIPVNVGYDLGLFKKHGLDLAIVDFDSGSKMAQAITAGSIDIAVGAGANMVLILKGAPMKAVCEDEGTFPYLSIGAAWDSPIKSLMGLKGKKIGISASGSLTEWLAHELARKEGWGENGVTTVAIGNGSAAIVSALRVHLVDADIGGTSQFLDMEEKKSGHLVAPVSDFEGDVAAGDLYASDRLIAANPDVIRSFLEGWLDTIAYMRAHKVEAVKLASKATGFPESVMAREYDITIGMFRTTCRFDRDALETLKRSFLEQKLVDAPPEMTKLYTEAYAPQ